MTCDLQAIRERVESDCWPSEDNVYPRIDARNLLAEVDRLHTWDGLMSLLDEHYPVDVWTATSHDPGARIVALTRAVDRLMAAIEQRDTTLRECRSFLADLAGDYSLQDHGFTHVLFTGMTERIDAALEDNDG